MTSAPASLSCPNCLRRFRWSPALADKKVKCPCGHLFTAPATNPTDDSLYELVSPSTPPPKVTPPPALPIEKQKSRIENPLPLSYQSKTSPAAADPDLSNKVRDFHAPLILLVAGIVIQSISALLESRRAIVPISPVLAITQVGLELLLGTFVMIPALFIAARFRGIEFGRFPVAVFKLAALSIAPGAFMIFLYFFLQVFPFSWLITAVLGFVFYFTAIGFLFDLDQSDTWYCVCVIFILNVVAYFASSFLLSRLFS